MKTTAIILSGGSGKRFGSDVPKQYIEVRGKCILSYTIEAFEKSEVDEIVIVAAADYIPLCWQIARDIQAEKVKAVITGGKERYDSVLQGLLYVDRYSRQPGPAETSTDEAPDTDIVLIHDGARPFIRPETIAEIIRQAGTCKAAIAGTPCTDTIKIVDGEGCITDTTDRSRTWAAQTPQAFELDGILQAYEKIIGKRTSDEDLQMITDDAMVYQLAFPGRHVRMVNAGADNFKITAPKDLSRAESMLAEE